MFHERVHDAPLPVYYKAGETNRAKMLSITHQFLQIVQYFDPVCRHLVLVLPLCKYYREQVNLQSHNWSALLLGHPLDVPRRLIADLDRDQKRKLHYSLANALLEVEKSKDEQDIDKISLILETYSDFKVVQKSVLSVLCRLLEDEAIREKTQSSTLPGTLFSIIDKMEPEEGVTVKALFTVMLLLRPKGGAEGVLLRAARQSVLDVPAVLDRGIPSVLRCMHIHAHNPRIQEMGCWALVNIAIRAPHKQALLKAGAIASVVETMNRHEKDQRVQYRALFALINLVTLGVRHENTLALISSEEIMDRVMKSTSMFLACRDVADRGCMVLYNLSLDERNHSYLSSLGILDLMQKAIQLHPGDKVLESILQSSSGRLRGDV